MESAEKISITLTPELLRQIRDSVENGEYVSTSEALRDAAGCGIGSDLKMPERLAAIRARVRR